MQSYDYIIVGAGSAGCVLANRLSADPSRSVLVLEAGVADTKPEIKLPFLYPSLLGTEIDWGYVSEREKCLKNRQIAIGQGKVLGGGSSINAMMYVRGNPADYDHWQTLGNKGWSYEDVLPYFRQIENNQLGMSEFNGTHGLLNVGNVQDPHPLSLAFIDAAVAKGYPRNKNFNGEHQSGVGLYLTSIKNGQRHSSAAAFLHPVSDRPNLHVKTEAFVTQILFDKKRAAGVSYLHEGKNIKVYANKEIIISAGALNSPKLLMLSGIGPADLLATFNIPVIENLPGVGSNLQDHPNFAVSYATHYPTPALSSNGCEAGLFTHSPGENAQWPDLQLDTYFEKARDADTTHFVFSGLTLRPKSRGTVSLRTTDVFAQPFIQFNYLQDERDLVPLLQGIKITRQIARALQLEKLLGEEVIPGKKVTDDDKSIIDFIRENVNTTWHPSGTCKMGTDHFAVVDAALKVHGIEHLRVVDASIMPTLTSGNTNAPCLMIGAKAADLILQIG